MEQLAQEIVDIFYDYHYFDGVKFNADDVIKWVSQFDKKDQIFILTEFHHVCSKNKIYISEKSAKKKLIQLIEKLTKDYRFKDEISFLNNADFLKMQAEGKSQTKLLMLLDTQIQANYGIALDDCGMVSNNYAIYIDDIIATGNTVFYDCIKWLELSDIDGETNFSKVISNKKKLIIYSFCLHTWPNIHWKLKEHFKNSKILNKIIFLKHYTVENHYKQHDQKFNLAYPIENQPQVVSQYLENLPNVTNGLASQRKDIAYRKQNTPKVETFFSSAANRIRFENIILTKGIELLEDVSVLKTNQRPLGMINPSYQTFGTGTLFFTWTNIPNNSPIVFWWESKKWRPLFLLNNRGN